MVEITLFKSVYNLNIYLSINSFVLMKSYQTIIDKIEFLNHSSSLSATFPIKSKPIGAILERKDKRDGCSMVVYLARLVFTCLIASLLALPPHMEPDHETTINDKPNFMTSKVVHRYVFCNCPGREAELVILMHWLCHLFCNQCSIQSVLYSPFIQSKSFLAFGEKHKTMGEEASKCLPPKTNETVEKWNVDCFLPLCNSQFKTH